jgi:hypothetical protein
MANKKGRRRFGWVRKLPSGRFQASYLGPDGQRRYAPDTFESKTAADQHLVKVESLITAGEWTDPARAKIKLADYAERWIAERPALRARRIELYRWLLAKHITPHIGGMELGKLLTAVVRQWRTTLLEGGASTSIAAKSYRLLRAVMNTRPWKRTGSCLAIRAGSGALTRSLRLNGRCSPWRRYSTWPDGCRSGGGR